MSAKKTTKKTTAKKVTTPKKTVAKVTKKVAVKKVVKRATKKTAKKTTNKKSAHKGCGCDRACVSQQAFWVNNGPVIHSVQELLEALKSMTEEQFAYHTKREGNDFANWVKHCLKDSACATSLKKVRSRVGAVRVLSKKCTCK